MHIPAFKEEYEDEFEEKDNKWILSNNSAQIVIG